MGFIQPQASLSSKGLIHTVANQGGEGMQKQGRNSWEAIVQPWGRVLVPPQGIYMTVSLSSSAGTKAPTQVEDGNFRLGAWFLGHRPVTSPPTNQKKVTNPAALTPNFAYKNFSPKTIGEFGIFEHKPPILLDWPCNKPFSGERLTKMAE